MLTSALDGIRISIHVLAATIWVGGQFTLAGLVPSLRAGGSQVTAAATKAFGKLSWPAYIVLVLTGLWNVSSVNMSQATTAWKIVLGVKLFVVAISGLSAYIHTKVRTKAQIAIWGAISGTTAVASLIFGVFLAG